MNRCTECGKETKNPKFCSNRCSCINNNKRFPKIRVKKSKVCINCGKEFEYLDKRQKFCCSGCSAKYNNNKRAKKTRICEYCGNKINTGYPKKYCNYDCMKEHNVNKVIEKLMEGGTGIKYHNKKLRTAMFKIRGYMCERCGITSYNNEHIRLEIHHKNGKANDNRLENLEILCPNCHSQTKTYGSKNIGKSDRVYRYTRAGVE